MRRVFIAIALGLVFLAGCSALLPAPEPTSTPVLASVPLDKATRTPTPFSPSSSTPSLAPTLTFTPALSPSPTPKLPEPVRAMRLDYGNYAASRAGLPDLETQMRAAHVNLVALGAGRPEWVYFKWAGHPESWSGEVKDQGIDYLMEDARRFGQWASVDAVVDVYAPMYIQAHPELAALSWLGKPSQYLVNTTELVDGAYGRMLLGMIEAVAANYPVDSISITELMYYTEGYSDADKAVFMAATGRKDWPRLPNGLVYIDHPAIGQWRSQEIGRFLDKARAITSKYGKKLYVDASVTWNAPSDLGQSTGTRYDVILAHADKIILWDYFGMNGKPSDFSAGLARIVAPLGPDRIILSVGLWTDIQGTISPAQLEQALASAREGGLDNLWVTPSLLMTPAHWQALARAYTR